MPHIYAISQHHDETRACKKGREVREWFKRLMKKKRVWASLIFHELLKCSLCLCCYRNRVIKLLFFLLLIVVYLELLLAISLYDFYMKEIMFSVSIRRILKFFRNNFYNFWIKSIRFSFKLVRFFWKLKYSLGNN